MKQCPGRETSLRRTRLPQAPVTERADARLRAKGMGVMETRGQSRRGVLHVSEAFGGGLAAGLQEYVARTPELAHVLAYAPRPEAPVSDDDLTCFDDVILLPEGTWRRIRAVRRLSRRRDVDVVHAHSAYGGLYARLAVLRRRTPIVYTPHCYAFLRTDLSRAMTWLVRRVEHVLGFNTSVVAACSPYEQGLSRWTGARSHAVYVPNALPVDTSLPPTQPDDGGAVRLLGLGRLNPQKDPTFFAEAVEALRDAGVSVTATWVGDGEPRLRQRLEAAGVDVRGWLDRVDARKEFEVAGTVYLHCAQWEGFPFGILEAQAARTSTVVRAIESLGDFAFPLTVTEPADLVAAVTGLDEAPAREDAVLGMDAALVGNDVGTQRVRLLEVYSTAVGSDVTAGSARSSAE